ncbi:MAG: hypothetical protein SH817_06120 [Leptospira sp.]|nr:hypothetical protein [Leptospira sp.]
MESEINLLVTKIEDRENLYQNLENLISAALYHFPENIFWDFDFFVFRMISNAMNSPLEFKANSTHITTKVIAIFELFGAHSKIKFRYVHDLLYGYDWLKWILEKKKVDDDTDPFGDQFLDYIYHRGLEIIELIDKNDTNYPNLGGIYRNPFLFSRSIEEEIQLHKSLSESGLIPIDAWDQNAIPKSDKNYSLLRLERAKELGIRTNSLPGSHKI